MEILFNFFVKILKHLLIEAESKGASENEAKIKKLYLYQKFYNYRAIIKNSIVFPGAEIGEKAELGMCIVGVNQTIKPKGILCFFRICLC